MNAQGHLVMNGLGSIDYTLVNKHNNYLCPGCSAMQFIFIFTKYYKNNT